MIKIIFLIITALLISSCEKKPLDSNETIENETYTKDEILVNLKNLTESPIQETAKKAENYLNNSSSYSKKEMTEFINDGWTEWEELNRELPDEEIQEEVHLQYRVELISDAPVLQIISLSDSVDIDRVEANRGNCRLKFRDGINPVVYGEAIRFYIFCDYRNIREVSVYLKNGNVVTMSPKI